MLLSISITYNLLEIQVLGSYSDLWNENLWSWNSEICVLTGPPDDSSVHESLRNIALSDMTNIQKAHLNVNFKAQPHTSLRQCTARL